MSTIRFKIDRLEKLMRLFIGTEGTGVLVLSVKEYEALEKSYLNKDQNIVKGGGGYLVVPQILTPEKWTDQSSWYYLHLSEPKDWW